MTSKTTATGEVWFGQPLVPGKVPLKKNLFEEVIHATGTLELVPVFPYLDNGAIVPCLSVSLGRTSTQRFQFFHDNVVSEVLLCLAGGSAGNPSRERLKRGRKGRRPWPIGTSWSILSTEP